ncbi:glyoxalase ElbB [Anaplasma platys]|uniref:Glyoxalase ElbB n=1 Tax=Anaplasma platys TaxID=949 RepID=A0A858PX34_9RICK|nr:isoprenoid biosynthesis glyoxalase ElbB [Anaplasma platys]QJC27147.1 glyoxalase ElbB [Anaplasma platys]
MNCVVLLSGCGHKDGSEIRESVFVLLELDRLGVNFSCCAPATNQLSVVNHLDGVASNDVRNIQVEAARIARGNVVNINDVNSEDYDMLVVPGGLGVANNFSDLFSGSGRAVTVCEPVKRLVCGFYDAKKSLGAVCIAPAVIAAALRDRTKVKVTIGEDPQGLIARCGGEHVECPTDSFVVDPENRVFSCSAYMRDDRLYKIHNGIKTMIEAMVDFTNLYS